MKELKDMILKKGDLLYWVGYRYATRVDEKQTLEEYLQHSIYNLEELEKIERPVKYETIYEVPKQILDKEELTMMKQQMHC